MYSFRSCAIEIKQNLEYLNSIVKEREQEMPKVYCQAIETHCDTALTHANTIAFLAETLPIHERGTEGFADDVVDLRTRCDELQEIFNEVLDLMDDFRKEPTDGKRECEAPAGDDDMFQGGDRTKDQIKTLSSLIVAFAQDMEQAEQDRIHALSSRQ